MGKIYNKTSSENIPLQSSISGICCISYLLIMMLCSLHAAALRLPSGHNNDFTFGIGSGCKPLISESKSDNNNFRQMECEISTCSNISKIVYEKRDINNRMWMPVFEGINKTDFHVLKKGFGNYSLANRCDYASFHTKHLLYIKPLMLEDQGDWRCVVVYGNNKTTESQPKEVNIYVTPNVDSMNIAPTNPILVKSQSTDFSCTINGIHPEPDIAWMLNGVQLFGGISSNTKRSDGLWFVMNALRVRFDKSGQQYLRCIVKTKTNKQLLEKNMNIDVKESAYVSHPTEKMTILVPRNSTYTINCSGLGYKPRITWHRNGITIHETDNRYIISHKCNRADCRSYLTSQSVGQQLTCDPNDVIEIYTCTVSLEQPYQSNFTSANITVKILGEACVTQEFGTLIAIVTVFVVLGILLVLVGFVIYIRKSRGDTDKGLEDQTSQSFIGKADTDNNTGF